MAIKILCLAKCYGKINIAGKCASDNVEFCLVRTIFSAIFVLSRRGLYVLDVLLYRAGKVCELELLFDSTCFHKKQGQKCFQLQALLAVP